MADVKMGPVRRQSAQSAAFRAMEAAARASDAAQPRALLMAMPPSQVFPDAHAFRENVDLGGFACHLYGCLLAGGGREGEVSFFGAWF